MNPRPDFTERNTEAEKLRTRVQAGELTVTEANRLWNEYRAEEIRLEKYLDWYLNSDGSPIT